MSTTELSMNGEARSQLEQRAQNVLERLAGRGATAGEVDLSIATGLSVTVRMGEVETVEFNKDQGLALTAYFGRRKGTASTSDLSDDAIEEAVNAACSLARYTAEDQYAGLADAALMARDYPDLDLCHPWPVEPRQAIAIATECERNALSYDPRISNSEGATVSTHRALYVYGNTHGFVGGYPTSRHSISCSVIAGGEDAMQRDYWFTTARDAQSLESAEEVGRKAGMRAVRRLDARRLSTRQVPVLFAAEVANSLLAHFVTAIHGANLYRGSSFLLDSLGRQVFPDWVRIYEDPLMRRGLGSVPFDGEGVAVRKSDVVVGGVVQRYILDSYAARKLGMQTTGNAGGVHNLTLVPGDHDLDGLVRLMDTGVLVTELMGQGVNKVTGDYSRGAAGFWVEKGEIRFPVEEITVAGNLQDMFRTLVAVGNDIDRRRNMLTGSILVEQMTVAGN